MKLDLLTDIDMFLMVGKGICVGIYHSINMQKLTTNTREIMKTVKNRYMFNIWM